MIRQPDHARMVGATSSCNCRVPQVFPPEPPVAKTLVPERRGVGKGAPAFGAAKRTLVHRAPFWHSDNFDGRRSGNTFPLVGSELFLPLFPLCQALTSITQVRPLPSTLTNGGESVLVVPDPKAARHRQDPRPRPSEAPCPALFRTRRTGCRWPS